MADFITLLAFLGGIFVSPLVILSCVGGKRILWIAKHALSDAEAAPQTSERVALINELKERIETLERLLHPRSD